jgi:uncharacterized membrane protein YidH (DUF202 family)
MHSLGFEGREFSMDTSCVRICFWFETGLALLSGALAILTLFWDGWIEALTGFDPDHHNGSLEWAIVGGLAVISIVVALAARAEWRRPRAIVATSSV